MRRRRLRLRALTLQPVHQVGLVEYESYVHAWVLDLPGCVTGGADLDGVATMLPLVIGEHEAWLACHGETVAGSTQWEIGERIDAQALAATGGEFLFEAERAPLTSEEMGRRLAHMSYARVDLVDAMEGLPAAILDWEPPRSAATKFDPWAPKVRTMRDIFEHVLQLEVYYREGLRDGQAAGIFERTGDHRPERQRTIDLLTSLSAEQRSRVFRPVRPGRNVPESWTVRKVLRRIISHERVHGAEILQRRVWLLLGVPALDGGNPAG